MEVSEHFVQLPAAQEMDDVCVHVGAEKRICSCCSEATGTDVIGEETQ